MAVDASKDKIWTDEEWNSNKRVFTFMILDRMSVLKLVIAEYICCNVSRVVTLRKLVPVTSLSHNSDAVIFSSLLFEGIRSINIEVINT